MRFRPGYVSYPILFISLAMLAACTVALLAPPLVLDTKASAPVLNGYGASSLEPSQANDAARPLFAQAMAQAYAFNEAEAIRGFKAALAKDPSCALCAWGVAYQMGPNINNTQRGDLKPAISYIDYAIKHSAGASARDLGLIEALALRYGDGEAARGIVMPPGEICSPPDAGPARNGNPLDIVYAEKMQQLRKRFPDDPDVLSMYAEAELIVTHNRWDRAGKPGGRIGELANLLEAGLVRHPEHVGLNHYMIHVVDAVPVASRALAAADRLGTLAPNSPHLVHMPAHTYAHLGRYADATRVNALAVAADGVLAAELRKQNFSLSSDWRMHNQNFQWYAALMEGRGKLALEVGRALATRTTADGAYYEYIRSLPILTLLRLQRWDDLLKEAMPRGEKGVAKLLGEMARGIALAHGGQMDEARAALARITPQAELMIKQNTANDLHASTARSVAHFAPAQLSAEIAFAAQQNDEAIAQQTKAVAAAVNLDNREPPMLANAPLQRLAEMQLRAKRFSAAELNYRNDLALHPANGWALLGLHKALVGQDKQSDAQKVQAALSRSWAKADSQLRATLDF